MIFIVLLVCPFLSAALATQARGDSINAEGSLLYVGSPVCNEGFQEMLLIKESTGSANAQIDVYIK
jgi:hypothetical protein